MGGDETPPLLRLEGGAQGHEVALHLEALHDLRGARPGEAHFSTHTRWRQEPPMAFNVQGPERAWVTCAKPAGSSSPAPIRRSSRRGVWWRIERAYARRR